MSTLPERVVPSVERLRQLELIGPLDEHFARALVRMAGDTDPRVALAAAMASRQVGNGHVCLPLPRLCSGELALELSDEGIVLEWPELDAWQRALRNSIAVGDGSRATPLVLDAAGRLYLQRYHDHEQRLARALLARATAPAPALDAALLARGLDRLLGAQPGAAPARSGEQLGLFDRDAGASSEPDLQRAAAEAVLRARLGVVSGGPGTGKTATVVKMLALIAEQRRARGEPPARTHLLAPTGKAAQRLTESIRRAKAKLEAEPGVREAIAEDASTVHRALGVRGGGRGFIHGRARPLATDVVVVDEASMVDLSLMARLVDAVPDAARLILLGDRDQLASVEAGAVLGDICGAGVEAHATAPLARCVVHLRRSYRYGEDSGIGQLARAINAADADAAIGVLRDPALPDVRWLEADAVSNGLHESLAGAVLEGLAPYLDATTPAERLQALDRFRVLCAHRHGPYGLLALNRAVEALLERRGRLVCDGLFYEGRPVLIAHNDYPARLFNGDVGVLAREPGKPLAAYFGAGEAGVRRVSASRLPAHETAFATSVHKSQGSELDAVAIVLPASESRLLSRELLYTAVTRARRQVLICGPERAVRTAVCTAVERASGLADALWGAPA